MTLTIKSLDLLSQNYDNPYIKEGIYKGEMESVLHVHATVNLDYLASDIT